MASGERIGCAIITYNRPESFLRLYASIPRNKLDYFIVVNDGEYFPEFKGLEVDEFIQHETNEGVGRSKNDALRRMLEHGIDHIFLIEDDIYLTDDSVFERYVEASKASGIQHFNYSQHGLLNKTPDRSPNPNALARYGHVEVAFYPYCVGAFSYYSLHCLQVVGLMDEVFFNAMEHVDHTLRIILEGLHPAYYYFADIGDSSLFFGEDEWSIEQSSISSQVDHSENYKKARELFEKKHDDVIRELRPEFQKLKISLERIMRSSGLIGKQESFTSRVKLQNQDLLDNLSALLHWLERRSPASSQVRLIEHCFENKGGGPSFGIFILDLRGDLVSVTETLKSLDGGRNFYANTCLVVLSTYRVPESYSSEDLRFIHISLGAWIEQLNHAWAESACDWLMLVRAGDEFTAAGLQTLALELLEATDCRAVYGDELHRQTDASLSSWFRPAFNLDYMLSYPAAMSRHWFFRRDVFIAQDGFDPQFRQSFELDLILRLVESDGMAGLAHVAEPILITDAPLALGNEDEQQVLLRHLQVRGYEHASVSSSSPGQYRIDYGHQATPGVSILIPLEASLGKLQRCVETLLEHTDYPRYEVGLIAGHNCPTNVADWAARIAAISGGKIQVLSYPESPNVSAMYNAAAAEVGGEYLVILSGDVEFVSGDWLDEMLNHAQRPEVGAVGAKISYASGPIRHAGIVLGLRGPAGGGFIGEAGDAPGYMGRLQVVQNYSAVSRACMMVSRLVFADVGGLDTLNLTRDFADVDFCLKVQAAGYLMVWTPFAALCQGIESGDEKATDNHQEQLETERHALYKKWLPQLARDPAYNQNLSLDGFGFTPAYRKTREWNHIGPVVLPRVLCHPSDANGCGHYRLHQPFFAMERGMLIQGMSTDQLLAPVELERFAPDSIIYQRQFTPRSLLLREESNIYKGVFRVMDMDDFIPGVPEKSIHYNQIPKNVMVYISKALSLVDRFVVSTAPLAEAFSGLHPDIQVVQNRLPVEWWGNLQSQRRVSRKPRVGWAGGTSHTGDLELLFDVVRTLANEVEWVFFGMCPDMLRPYVHEFHAGISIEKYPERLASLNLDLALAPLEMNLFNECKSNLRLLEYGACGFPVVCTDIVTYRCGMPVTLVKNRTEDWLEAIRMHLADLDATAKAGDALREVVRRDWLLQGDALLEWHKAWLPS